MKLKWTLIMGIVLVIAVVVLLQMQHDPAPASPAIQGGLASEPASPAVPVAAPPQEPAPAPSEIPVAPALAAAPVGTPAPVVDVPRSTVQHDVSGLGMNRLLSGQHRVTLEGREHTVLGTKPVGSAESPQAVLLVRDEASGKVDYWQSGLRIVLKPGNDHEAFVKERSKLNRRFVNVVQADVLVDAADIASEYAAIQADPRVASVEFLPLPNKVNLR